MTAVAVPVRSREGTMVAGMSVFGSSNRFDIAASERAANLLLRAAKDATMLF